jgi:hypothetical protein
MVVWDEAMPRSAIIWTRSRELSLNVRYHLMHRTIAGTDPLVRSPNGVKENERRGPSRPRDKELDFDFLYLKSN